MAVALAFLGAVSMAALGAFLRGAGTQNTRYDEAIDQEFFNPSAPMVEASTEET